MTRALRGCVRDKDRMNVLSPEGERGFLAFLALLQSLVRGAPSGPSLSQGQGRHHGRGGTWAGPQGRTRERMACKCFLWKKRHAFRTRLSARGQGSPPRPLLVTPKRHFAGAISLYLHGRAPPRCTSLSPVSLSWSGYPTGAEWSPKMAMGSAPLGRLTSFSVHPSENSVALIFWSCWLLWSL